MIGGGAGRGSVILRRTFTITRAMCLAIPNGVQSISVNAALPRGARLFVGSIGEGITAACPARVDFDDAGHETWAASLFSGDGGNAIVLANVAPGHGPLPTFSDVTQSTNVTPGSPLADPITGDPWTATFTLSTSAAGVNQATVGSISGAIFFFI